MKGLAAVVLAGAAVKAFEKLRSAEAFFREKLPNRSFERPDNPFNPTRPFGWVKGVSRPDLVRYVIGIAHSGQRSMAIDIESGPDVFGCRFDGGSLETEDPVAQTPGEKTLVSFWAKPEVAAGHTNIDLHPTMFVAFFKDTAGTVCNGAFVPSPDSILEDKGWLLYMFELNSANIPAETVSMRLGPVVSGGSAEPGCPSGIVATVWFDDVSARSENPFPPPRGGRIPIRVPR